MQQVGEELQSWPSAEIFPCGGTVDILLIFFQVAKDAMQMDLHKTLHHFCSAPQRKLIMKARAPLAFVRKLYSGGVVIVFAQSSYFFVILYSFR